jgi:hypothetical protein
MKPSLPNKPSSVPAHVTDSGKIVMGAGMRLPTAPAHVADEGKIVMGAGMRLPVERKAA